MTQDEIIDMARQTLSKDIDGLWLAGTPDLEAFAKLVTAKAVEREREACAVAGFHACLSRNDAVRVRKAIRARGETTLRGEA